MKTKKATIQNRQRHIASTKGGSETSSHTRLYSAGTTAASTTNRVSAGPYTQRDAEQTPETRVSKNFVNFIEGLGIPYSQRGQGINYEQYYAQQNHSSQQQNQRQSTPQRSTDESGQKKRILSARQRPEPILVVNNNATLENGTSRTLHNTSSQLHSPSQRNSKLKIGKDSSPQ